MKKRLLLYSTGLDSELYRLVEEPEILMFFKSGARYEQKELEQLERFKKYGFLDNYELIVDDTLNFRALELDNAIVPMRNIFYLLRAFQYSENVMLGVTGYDLHYDKMPDVLSALTGFIQNYYYFRDVPETWDGVQPTVLTPHRDKTKGELLALAIELGCNVEHIPVLRTCYSATSEKGCGRCKSCVQKAIALAVNGMFHKNFFDADPRIHGRVFIDEFLEVAPGTVSDGLLETFKHEVAIFLQ